MGKRHVSRTPLRLTEATMENLPPDLRIIVKELSTVDPCKMKILRDKLRLQPAQYVKLDRKLKRLIELGIVKQSACGQHMFVRRPHGTHPRCARKTRFVSSYDAERYAERSGQITGVTTKVYRCPHCDGYHRATRKEAS